MYTLDQEKKILSILEVNKTARIDELSQGLQVSPATVRRYLDRLSTAGRIERIHGGAKLIEEATHELPVQLRMSQNQEEKKNIGRAAANLIQEGDTVFIGSGTTSLEVAKHLGSRKISVVTNSIPVMNALAGSPNITIIGIGGFLRSSELSFVGHIADQTLRELFMDKVIMGVPAIDVQSGLSNDYLPEVVTDRTILERGRQLIVVADHTKFGKVASAFLAPVERIDTLVTDSKTDPEILRALEEIQVKVIIAK
jgi:DeoR family transcriptional regulator, aga operon transcriptional repressor